MEVYSFFSSFFPLMSLISCFLTLPYVPIFSHFCFHIAVMEMTLGLFCVLMVVARNRGGDGQALNE